MGLIRIGVSLVILGLLVILFQKFLGWEEKKPKEPLSFESLMFKGRIGKKYPIKMSLKRKGENLSGTLFNSFNDKKDLRGKIYNENIFILKEFEGGSELGNFIGRYISKNKIAGIWATPDWKGVFPFHLYKNTQSKIVDIIKKENITNSKYKKTF